MYQRQYNIYRKTQVKKLLCNIGFMKSPIHDSINIDTPKGSHKGSGHHSCGRP